MLIDIIFAALIVFACINGYRKGFIVALFAVIAFIVGLAAALKLSAVVAVKLSESVNVSNRALPVIAFILVFLVVALLVSLGGRLIQKAVEAVMMGWINRIAGSLLYFFLYCIIFSIFLFYAIQLHLIKEETVSASLVYPYIHPLGPKVMNAIGSVIPFFKDIFAQLERFFGDVSNKIEH